MNLIDSINIKRYHNDKIRRYGAGSVGALGWKKQEGQEARFEILAQAGDMNNASVMDVGCGHGDLFAFLNERFTGIRYFGIDLETSFLDVAIEKYNSTGETAFFQGDFSVAELPCTDYILACGALSYKNSDPEYAVKMISKLFHSCRIGFAFNMLKKADNPEGLLVAYDPVSIFAHCKSLTENVVLKEGYYEQDFTVMMYHNPY